MNKATEVEHDGFRTRTNGQTDGRNGPTTHSFRLGGSRLGPALRLQLHFHLSCLSQSCSALSRIILAQRVILGYDMHLQKLYDTCIP